MLCLFQNKKNSRVLVTLLFITFIGYAQSNDSIASVKTEKAGYTSDIENGILSITAFLAMQDDAEAETLLRFSALDSLASPWYKWKRKVNDKIGLLINTGYVTTTMYGQNSPNNESEFSAAGMVKLYTKWNLINRGKLNTGNLVFALDHRHGYTPVTPGQLGFELGYNGMPGLLFTDVKIALLDLSWQQKFNKGRTGIVIGRFDPNDYMDVLGYVNPFTTFQNLAVLVNPSIALPDSSTGIGIGHWIKDQFSIQATVNDANGVSNEVWFFEDFGELYTSLELSWSPSKAERFFKNVHIMAWHSDYRERLNIEESQGVAIGVNWTFHDTFMPFLKMGWSAGGAPIYSQSYTGGLIWRPNLNKDLLGLGVNWGETQSGIGQLSTELFYRFQVSQNFAVTPNVQYYKNPALNTNLDNAFVVGFRGRIAL